MKVSLDSRRSNCICHGEISPDPKAFELAGISGSRRKPGPGDLLPGSSRPQGLGQAITRYLLGSLRRNLVSCHRQAQPSTGQSTVRRRLWLSASGTRFVHSLHLSAYSYRPATSSPVAFALCRRSPGPGFRRLPEIPASSNAFGSGEISP